MPQGPDRNLCCKKLGGQHLHPYKRPIGYFAPDLTIIQESIKKKNVRGPGNRRVYTEEPFFPVLADPPVPFPSTTTIRVPLSTSFDIANAGLYPSGSTTNLGNFQSNNGVEGGNSYRVDANNQGLFIRNPMKLMPLDFGEFSVYLNGHDAGGSGTANYILSVNENLVFRWESGSQELRLYPDLTNYPSDYIGINRTSAQWYSGDATWHKYKIKWSYEDQDFQVFIDGIEGVRTGSFTIPFPGWGVLDITSIFTDLNNENNVYHDAQFINFGPPEFDPIAMDRLTSMFEPTGFLNKTDSTIDWSDSGPDRTLIIAPASTSFDYYIGAVKYTKSSSETIQITDTDGLWVIYYDGNTLTSLHDPTHAQLMDLYENHAIIAFVYWNVALAEGKLFEERHGIKMDGRTHVYLHETVGAAWDKGLALGDILADDTGADDEDAQFSNTLGEFWDEDLENEINAVGNLTGLEIWYNDNGVWFWDTNAGFSVIDDGVGARLAYNDVAGGPLVEVANNKFVLCHVFATNLADGNLIALVGQDEYISKSGAQAAAETEILTLLLGDLPTPEMLPIATVIFQTSNAYGNAVKARIVSTSDGDDYIDWRIQKITAGAGVSVPSITIAQAGGTGGTYSVLAGAINGVNVLFVTPSNFDPTQLRVIMNTNFLLPDGDDYTVIAANIIQMTDPPPTGSALITMY